MPKLLRVPSRLLLVCILFLIIPQIKITAQTSTSMLAVVNTDGNIIVYDANGQNPFTVTTDAKARARVYHWPTWSTDGRLAFFGSSTDKVDPYALRVFIQDKVAL